MERWLLLLEVSQKQAYIFASRTLRDNLRRSAEICYATSEEYFSLRCPSLYSKENMVYTGGGHTVLQFPKKAAAKAFSQELTEHVLRDFPDMELFVKTLPYDPALTPGENLTALSAALEKKKAERRASFRILHFGAESPENKFPSIPVPQPVVKAPPGWELTDEIDLLAKEDNFIAVVHLDGNAMGRRLQTIYSKCGTDWEECARLLRRFSEDIDRDFGAAYDSTAAELAEALEGQWPSRYLPMRKIIGAGDDVCFVCAGSLGLECAAAFLENLGGKVNSADGEGYAACAGVVLVHKKYPFRVAYDLSEELCSSAKRYGAALSADGSVCALDWHIEFGQLKDSLSAVRENYTAEDGSLMNLRPIVVSGGNPPIARTYDFFKAVSRSIKNKNGSALLARSKTKALRTAFSQGEQETEFALRSTCASSILWYGLEKLHPDWLGKMSGGQNISRSAYFTDESEGTPVRRCLYFDAIETEDHLKLWREEKA